MTVDQAFSPFALMSIMIGTHPGDIRWTDLFLPHPHSDLQKKPKGSSEMFSPKTLKPNTHPAKQQCCWLGTAGRDGPASGSAVLRWSPKCLRAAWFVWNDDPCLLRVQSWLACFLFRWAFTPDKPRKANGTTFVVSHRHLWALWWQIDTMSIAAFVLQICANLYGSSRNVYKTQFHNDTVPMKS